MVNTVNSLAVLFLVIFTFLCLYRAFVGPSTADRVVAINVIGSKTIVIIALVSFVYKQEFFIDVALVYSLIAFAMTIGVSKYLEKGALE